MLLRKSSDGLQRPRNRILIAESALTLGVGDTQLSAVNAHV